MALPPQRINLVTNPGMESGGAATALRTNLATNPTFETNATGYSVANQATMTQFASTAMSGANVGRITFTAATIADSGINFAGAFAALPSKTYTISLDALSSLTRNVKFSAQGTGSVAQEKLAIALTAGVKTRISFTFQTTATAPTDMAVYLLRTDLSLGTIDIDQVLIEESAGVGTYFDGATAAAGDFTYGWTGTAHASTSTQRAVQSTGVSAVAGTGGAGFIRRTADTPYAGTYCARYEWTKAGTSGSAGVIYQHTQSGVAGDVRSGRLWVRSSVDKNLCLLFRFRNNTTVVGSAQTAYVTIPANTWTEFKVDGLTATGTYTNIQLYALINGSQTQNFGDTLDLDMALIETGLTSGPAFDGSSTDPNYTHVWNGTPNASTSTRDMYGIWVEQVAGPGAPKVQVSAIGLGGVAVNTQVTRQCGRELWSVPGWKSRNSLGADTYTDATPPLGRPVTYTLLKDGLTVNSMTITVESTTGWVMDPLSPGTAMPVATTDADPNVLALGKAALKKLTYAARFEEETPLGGQYPIVRANQRGGASGVEFHLNAYANAVSDALQQLVLDAPILLFRGLPSWGSIPALAYLIGDVEEAPYNRDRGGQFTTWLAGGKLATPVALGPITGTITNAMVQDNLAGRTNASIQSTTGSKRNIDVQANPLGLGQ